MRTPIVPPIKVELVKFADGLGRIARALAQGSLSPEEAHRLKDRAAGTYARHIARAIQEDEDHDPMPEGAALLTDFGVEPLTAHHLAAECSLHDIQGWIAYARRATRLINPPGLVVARLRQGVPAPKVSPRRERRPDYQSREYGQYIQH